MNKKVSNMYLAGALKAAQIEILEVDRTNERRQEFIFKEGPNTVWILEDGQVAKVEYADLDQIEMAYRCGKLMVSAEDYANGLRSVKNMLYDK